MALPWALPLDRPKASTVLRNATLDLDLDFRPVRLKKISSPIYRGQGIPASGRFFERSPLTVQVQGLSPKSLANYAAHPRRLADAPAR